MFYFHYNYNIRVTHRNGAIKHILHESDPRRIIGRLFLLFILSLHALALHLAVKILLQIFLYEDLSTLTLHTSCQLYFLQNTSDFFITQPILLVKTFLIFILNHQQNTRSDQIET